MMIRPNEKSAGGKAASIWAPQANLWHSMGMGVNYLICFFGLWHWGWNPETLAWPHVLWTMLAGVIFGIMREKSESVIAPAIFHCIMNYGPQAILFYLFWN